MHTTATHLIAVVALSTLLLSGCSPESKSNEVLVRQDGQDRHWIVRKDGLIVEEHYLTVHGDVHVVIEYEHGVKTPQLKSHERGGTGASRVKMFWPKGEIMSETSAFDGLPNGTDRVWWETGHLAREGSFEHGRPVGVWKYYRRSGEFFGEGSFLAGRRHDGTFVGLDNSGGNFFFGHDLQVFKSGKMVREDKFDGL